MTKNNKKCRENVYSVGLRTCCADRKNIWEKYMGKIHGSGNIYRV